MKRFDSDKFKKSGFLLLGDEPFAMENDVLKQRIHTFFVTNHTYVTTPGVHATQRYDFVDYLNRERREKGEPELTSTERQTIMNDAVSIVVPIDPDTNEPKIGIRIDGNRKRAEEAVEVLSPFFAPGVIQLIDL